MECTIIPPPPRSKRLSRLTGGFTRVRVGLGLLLLVAAALKLAGMGADPVARMGVFSAPEFQLTVVVFEAFLAVWLLSGKNPVGSWLVSLGGFGLFAVVSFYQGTIGQSSCGCFGRLSVSPWAAFGLDVLILGALLVGRPDPTPHSGSSRTNLRSALVPAAWGIAGGLSSAAFSSVGPT